jgi:hypothetical protein
MIRRQIRDIFLIQNLTNISVCYDLDLQMVKDYIEIVSILRKL